MTAKERLKLIDDIEGEIMLGAFYGNRMPVLEERLLELLKEEEMSSDKLVQCDICSHWMLPWLVCDATEHCPYYDEGDVGP
jgi:hypothetical protein